MRGYLPIREEEEYIRVYDLYKEGKGIFHHLNEIEKLPFTQDNDVSNIDITFITLYGDRVVSKPIRNLVGKDVTPEKIQQIASMLYGMYFSKWSNLYEVYSEKVDLDTYRMDTEEKVTDDSETSVETTQNTEDTVKHEVTGFNSPEYENANKDTTNTVDTTTNTGSNKNTKDRTNKVKGNQSNRIDDRSKALQTLRGEILHDTVFKDVAQLVGQLVF